MARYPLFGTGLKGKSSNVTAQSRINMYLEPRAEDDKSKMVAYGLAGKDLFVSFGETPIRGARALGDYLYCVHRGTLWQVSNAGVKTSLGSLLTSEGRVGIYDNGNIIQIVDGSYGYTYNISTSTFAQITDADFVAGYTNTWLDGYFIKDRRGSTNKTEWGRFDISLDGSTYDALDFANAESNPDYIQAVFVDHGQLILFGQQVSEVWSNSGSADFPLSYQSSATFEWGLASRWSVCKFGNSVMFLGKNKLGQYGIMQMVGYNPVDISGVDLSYIINNYSSVEDATAFSYMLNGHAMYQINFPTEMKSWVYDGLSGVWSEVQSNGSRDRAEIGTPYLNKYLVTDYENGNVYYLNPETLTENGTNILKQITSRHVFGETYVTVGRIILDIEAGVGNVSGQGVNPQVMLEVSKDGGHTWGQQIWRDFGAIGEYKKRAIWNRIGVAYDTVFRFTITDPIKVVIMGAYLDLE